MLELHELNIFVQVIEASSFTAAAERLHVHCRLVKELYIGKLKNMAYKFLCLVFLVSIGCFKYSFTGSLPSHIQKVAIPLFENNTSFTGVNQDLTGIDSKDKNKADNLYLFYIIQNSISSIVNAGQGLGVLVHPLALLVALNGLGLNGDDGFALVLLIVQSAG